MNASLRNTLLLIVLVTMIGGCSKQDATEPKPTLACLKQGVAEPCGTWRSPGVCHPCVEYGITCPKPTVLRSEAYIDGNKNAAERLVCRLEKTP